MHILFFALLCGVGISPFQVILIFHSKIHRSAYLCRLMEDWQLDFEWLRVRHWVKDRFNKAELPDLNAVLYLIGIQELGRAQEKFTKEEKQDLMHIAVCHLLSEEGYFEFEGMDADGWPHWKPLMPIDIKGLAAQEELLRRKVVEYFAPLLSNQEKI